MGLLIRTILVWLLVLAVPAQGASAATMAFCGPNHHGGSTASLAVQMAPAEHQHPQATAQTTHGHHDEATAAPDDVANADASVAPAKSVPAAKQKCSACASCCSIGAILSSVLAVPAPDLNPTVFSVVAPTVDAVAVDGPDRPPRIVLA